MVDCEHDWQVVDRDDNAQRTRTLELCVNCRRRRHGCFAKDVDADGEKSWGPIGEWVYSDG